MHPQNSPFHGHQIPAAEAGDEIFVRPSNCGCHPPLDRCLPAPTISTITNSPILVFVSHLFINGKKKTQHDSGGHSYMRWRLAELLAPILLRLPARTDTTPLRLCERFRHGVPPIVTSRSTSSCDFPHPAPPQTPWTSSFALGAWTSFVSSPFSSCTNATSTPFAFRQPVSFDRHGHRIWFVLHWTQVSFSWWLR